MFNFCIQECIINLHDTLNDNFYDSLKSDRSFENEDKQSYNSSKVSYSEISSSYDKSPMSNIFKQFKMDVEKQTRFIVHKIKLYNRTLS
jgi:hypothetical protein